VEYLENSSGWIFWDKLNGASDYSDGELAWTSFNRGLRKFSLLWNGFQRGEITERIHPTQKPVKLYEWLLKNYAKQGDKILDTHLGSGSIAIACYNLDFSLTGFEIDIDYYNGACNRLEEHKKQGRLFDCEAVKC
jgi:site-specific DNA-methyltransferase (adenine-specific)